jgi:hypothetical protein
VWWTVNFCGAQNDCGHFSSPHRSKRSDSSAPQPARVTTPTDVVSPVVAAAPAVPATGSPSVVLMATDRAPRTPAGMRTW